MAGGGVGGQVNLEHTPTWIVAVICFFVVLLSLGVERLLHYLGTLLQRKKQKALYEALQKVKSELMVLGFISLLLVVFQGSIHNICIPESFLKHMLPCKHADEVEAQVNFSVVHGGHHRRLLASSDSGSGCKKGKVPVLSYDAIHEMHLFLFVLATTHVILSAFTLFFGGLKMRIWKKWEDSIQKNVQIYVSPSKKTVRTVSLDVPEGIPEIAVMKSWLRSFFKQFYGSVTKVDYTTMRHYFVMTHCRGNQKFDFHKYMVRALESDFEKVVGVSWYLWICVVLFLLLNIHGLHAYFWMSFLPFILLFTVGTKLEHIIIQSAHDIAEQQSAIEDGMAVNPTDDHFWFHRPQIMLVLIHYILFQNAFEIAIFLWILTTYGFNSCIMGKDRFVITRLVISVVIQVVCSYSTLPLYAFVAQMGSSLKGIIFEEHFQESLASWALNGKNKKKSRRICDEDTMEKIEESGNVSAAVVNFIPRRTSLLELIRKHKDSLTDDSIQSITELESISVISENVVCHEDIRVENSAQNTMGLRNISATRDAVAADDNSLMEEGKAQHIENGDQN